MSEGEGKAARAGLKSLWVALGINLLAWLAYGVFAFFNTHPLGWILGMVGLAAALVVTTIGLVLVHLLLGPRPLAPPLRVAACCLPTAALLLAVLIALPPKPPHNQLQGITCASTRYRLSVTIEGGRWVPTIRDAAGRVVYRDAESDMLRHFNVYWVWDAEDRAWVYNSDDGAVYCYRRAKGGWEKVMWGRNKEKDSDLPFDPPAALYPDYVTAY